MDANRLLEILPLSIAIGNIIVLLLLLLRGKDNKRFLWLAVILMLTILSWLGAAIAYSVGMADSAASCLNQAGYPGCQGFEEMATTFGRGLGSFGYLALLCGFDILAVGVTSSLTRAYRRNRVKM